MARSSRNLFTVLAENGRLASADKVIEGFMQLMSAYRGEVEVTITTATVSHSSSGSRSAERILNRHLTVLFASSLLTSLPCSASNLHSRTRASQPLAAERASRSHKKSTRASREVSSSTLATRRSTSASATVSTRSTTCSLRVSKGMHGSELKCVTSRDHRTVFRNDVSQSLFVS